MHDHVDLLAGHSSAGEPARETVPAEKVAPDLYRIVGTPGLAVGCAEGDTVRIAEGGGFTVVARGGNVAVHVFGRLSRELVHDLQSAYRPLAGKVESPEDLRFVVVTVPVTAGFAAIENAVNTAIAGRDGVEWYFGNVYDDDDRPLNWWNQQ